ncbi:aspartic peptidase domain-containing protein [Trametes meyenii]|nr:aspartic peptidase domain-containing protein [Trametes meyenii]
MEGSAVPFWLAALPPLPATKPPKKDQRRQIYVVPVSVAGNTFNLIMDTGSADLWVDANSLPSGADLAGVVDTGIQTRLNYGINGTSTSVQGAVQLADVRLGVNRDDEQARVIVRGQAFVNVPGAPAVTQYGDQGILGLGPPHQWSLTSSALKGSHWSSKTVLQNLFDHNQELGDSFTILFGGRDGAGVIQNGTLAFGAIGQTHDEALHTALLNAQKLPLVTGSSWDIPSRGFAVDGRGPVERPFMLDSGSFAACVPPEYLRAIYSPVPGSYLMDDGSWSVPCDANMNVSVGFGCVMYPIHPIDMTEVYDIRDGKALCRSLIQPNSDLQIPFLIGLNILRNMGIRHEYGEQPYVQLLSTTDPEKAFAEFDAMNVARIDAFSKAATARNRPLNATYLAIIRRISSSFFPRPDRPWSEDATSTAPQIGRKRRLSTDEREERETTPSAKKQRADPGSSERGSSPARPEKETEEVKEVTKGVREVELEDGKAPVAQSLEGEAQAETSTQEAAAVPLPDSPELKAAEDTQEVDGDAAAQETDAADAAEPVNDESSSPEVEKPGVEETTEAPAEDEIPGLTLPTQPEEKDSVKTDDTHATEAATETTTQEVSATQ